jgi:hypothetical protein
VPFQGSNGSKNFQGVHFPHTPKIGLGIGISSLNKTTNNFSTVHAISAQISSISAAWRKKFVNFNEITKLSFYGSLFLRERPQWGFQAKTPC